MPIRSTVTRRLAAACLAVAALLAVAAGPAAALEPPRPLPGYRPAFVTETDERPWKDCLWASAAMLLDKWTNGDVIATHQRLRALSGDASGGSTFRDLHTAFAKLGFNVPDNLGGHRLSWGQLLSRLRRGAGAIVLGDYSKLPRRYGRWDYGFWNRRPVHKPSAKAAVSNAGTNKAGKRTAKPKPDNHAVYIERYGRGRVWLMDPLGRGGWHGEWISVSALKRFAWASGGHVYAVTTPTAAPAPFAGVHLAGGSIGLSDGAVTATWQVRATPKWHFPGGDVHVSIAPTLSPLEAAARSALLATGVTVDAAPASPTAVVAGHRLTLRAALPTTPGAYTASMSLTERRFGRQVVASDPVAAFVPGDQRATMRLNVLGGVLTAGGAVRVNLSVANGGEETWADPTGASGEAPGTTLRTARQRDTRVMAHWIRLDSPQADAGAQASADTAANGDAGDAAPVALMRVPLDPGELAWFRGNLVVPSTLGQWALVVDVEDSIVGSFAALGNAPAVAVFEVVPPRGIEAID